MPALMLNLEAIALLDPGLLHFLQIDEKAIESSTLQRPHDYSAFI